MVFIPFCFAEAAANLLTNPQLDPMGKIPEFKFCACKVEQAEMMAAAEEDWAGCVDRPSICRGLSFRYAR